jgi:cell fate regulator YaaT (PSP1 superfamily)
MPIAVGVAFKRVAKSYWFAPGSLTLRDMDRVIVETARGQEIGTVRITARDVPEDELQAPLKHVIRIATSKDLEREQSVRQQALSAMRIAKERVAEHQLPMKVIQAEYTFDMSQVTISFVSETRVDFRELVKDLAARLCCRVMLYQVGPRDHAKLLNGIGPCGLTLCCSTFLTEFQPVSMKMAKDQSLFLNPVKFSGVCGKLMCCLRYEHEDYAAERSGIPAIGDTVRTPQGQGRVTEIDLAARRVTVRLSLSGETIDFSAAEVQREKTEKCSDCRGCSVNEMKADYSDTANGDMDPEELNIDDIGDQ